MYSKSRIRFIFYRCFLYYLLIWSLVFVHCPQWASEISETVSHFSMVLLLFVEVHYSMNGRMLFILTSGVKKRDVNSKLLWWEMTTITRTPLLRIIASHYSNGRSFQNWLAKLNSKRSKAGLIVYKNI